VKEEPLRKVSRVAPDLMGNTDVDDSIGDMNQVLLWSNAELQDRKIIYPGMQKRDVLNAFREIRTKILMKSQSKNLVVLVSSVGHRGGASFAAINMAAAFAMDEGKTALYIDCNLEDTISDDLLPVPADRGITDYLADENLKIENIIYATGIHRLRIVPVGYAKDRAVEYFNSRRMHQFIREIKSRYQDRFIVIDTPSASNSIEARVLSQYCDASVLVVPSGQVVTDQIMAGIDALGKDKFAGLIFNN